MSKSILLLNPKSGGNRSRANAAKELQTQMEAAAPGIAVLQLKRSGIERQVREAIGGGQYNRVFVAGGDGSVSLAANALVGTESALGVIPMGTMNLVARSLSIPLSPAEAVRTLIAGEIGEMDLGRVGRRFFVHHVSFGIYPRLIRLREQTDTSSRLRKIWATMRSFPLVISNPKSMHWKVRAAGTVRDLTSPALIVSNNPFGPGHLPYTNKPDGGELGLYIARANSWAELALAGAAVLAGQAGHSQGIEIFSAPAIELGLAGNGADTVRASIDGELVRLPRELDLRVQKRALRVLRPRTGG